ncbi:MAG: aminopeptidase N [Campylobacterales bacterium]|nr:aminopeptidase N [Campylobacterales bacterium]
MSRIHRQSDYRPSAFSVAWLELVFDLYPTQTLVQNTMRMVAAEAGETLRLDGEHLELLSLTCNDKTVVYRRVEGGLEIDDMPQEATLVIKTRINPEANTQLEGLYYSNALFCTQNEPEGFRRITYCIDRPDVMTLFSTKIIADAVTAPVLLGNGNLIERGALPDGRHYALWDDPFAKPTYLFALVAGDLGSIHDTFVTMSGREIALGIYCDKGNEERCVHAMRSLKKAMAWDERVYGREYDLDIYNIVAVESFNMGAMENKGLNIFNAAYVLADEERATDANFMGIESVIAHEYFHNWTGNRITCKDWFELTLKEGLTVFRDQCFSADMNDADVQRIDDVRALRERQFVEDASGMAHPIKPQEYEEINNFYTATVYEKGAEVIRMLHTMLGVERWRAAMDLYFATFDGQAVRTQDFLWAVSQGGGIDLTQFERWYHQMRTPVLHVSTRHVGETLTLTLRQEIPSDTKDQPQLPYHFPLRFAFFDAQGSRIEPQLLAESAQDDVARALLLVRHEEEQFVFEGVNDGVRLSLNRGFSAPIIVSYDAADYPFLMRYETDGFARYEASQRLAQRVLLEDSTCRGDYLDAFAAVLEDERIPSMLKAQLLLLPSDVALIQAQEVIDIEAVASAKKALEAAILERCEETMRLMYERLNEPKNSAIDATSMGKRALKNLLLGYLCGSAHEGALALCSVQCEESVSMTDRIAALALLEQHAPQIAEPFLSEFYETYHDDMLVMSKYFALIASTDRDGVLGRVIALQSDPVYDIKVPNLVRALLGSFSRNLRRFHTQEGYQFIAERISALDPINPMIAAGLAGAFKSYGRMDARKRGWMLESIEGVLYAQTLSGNVREILEKTVMRHG